MSTCYSFYTEARIGDTWCCIDPRVLRLERKDTPMSYPIHSTYWNGSRSYFGEAYDKLEEISQKILFEDASVEFRMHMTIDWLGDERDVKPFYDKILYAISLSDLRELNEKAKKPENIGIYKKSDISLYEDGDIEDLYEREIDPWKYSELSDEAKKMYQYYEWNYAMSWKANIPVLYERVMSRIREFEDVNYVECDEFRVLMYAT